MENKLEQKRKAITGELSVEMANEQTIDDVCQQFITGYNRDRFEAIAIRVFTGNETIVTIYALDKTRQENSTQHEDKLPVKKFKLENITLNELLNYCSAFNFTLSTGNYNIEDMEVINK